MITLDEIVSATKSVVKYQLIYAIYFKNGWKLIDMTTLKNFGISFYDAAHRDQRNSFAFTE